MRIPGTVHLTRRTGLAGLLLLLPNTLAPVAAQRAPLVGTVSPSAVGAGVQQPAPLGGLRTVPLTAVNPSVRRAAGTPLRGSALRTGFATTMLTRVTDARTPSVGVVMHDAPEVMAAPTWMPSYAPPRWVHDSTAPASPLWRTLFVTDVLCNFAGRCVERTQRLQARWIARCDCYAFGDALGRVWRVENRRGPSTP